MEWFGNVSIMLQARVARHRANVLAMCVGMEKMNELRQEICRMQTTVDAIRASRDLLDHRDARALEELLVGNPVVAPEGWMSDLDNVVHFSIMANVTIVSRNGTPPEICSVSVEGVRGPIHSVLNTTDLPIEFRCDSPIYQRCKCPAVLIVKS